MASIKYTMVLLVALLGLSCVAEATKYKPKPKLCYEKATKCCYKIEKCGYETKVKEDYEKCKIKKCDKECKKYCYKVPKKECKKYCKKKPYKKCKIMYKYVTVCAKPKYKGYSHEHDYGYKPKPVCKEVKKKVKKCYTYYKHVCSLKCKTVYIKICKNKCKLVCKYVPGKKKVIKIIKYPKYCPKIKCSTKIIGSVKKPKKYAGTKGIYDKKKGKTGKCKPIKYKHYKY